MSVSRLLVLAAVCCATLLSPRQVGAQVAEPGQAGTVESENGAGESIGSAADGSEDKQPQLDIRRLVNAGGKIGWIIMALSVAAVALIVEHLLSIRRGALMPSGLAEETHQLIGQGKFSDAEQAARSSDSFLGHVLAAGLSEIGVGYGSVEKSMEDASAQQAARLFRKLEYLSVIGTIAPMLGLLGTVLGMIQAFLEFEAKANPQVSELAPGISQALVTTAMGLIVAVPALAGYAIFRNRIDGLVAEATLLAEHVFVDFKRKAVAKRKAAAQTPRAQKSAG